MSILNIYKIKDESTYCKFLKNLKNKLNARKIGNKKVKKFIFDLYLTKPIKNNVDWQWIIGIFDKSNKKESTKISRAILIVENENDYYAITFGNLYTYINDYCDKDFGIDFAKKIEFKSVNGTTLISPNLKKRKSIFSYVNYDRLDANPYESFVKIKGSVEINNKKKIIETGHSIRIICTENSLDNICKIIIEIEKIRNKPEINCIPVLTQVKDDVLVKNYNKIFFNKIKLFLNDKKEGDVSCCLDDFFKIKIKYKKYKSQEIETVDDLSTFCNENDIKSFEEFIKIKYVKCDEESNEMQSILQLFDCNLETDSVYYNNGHWFKYNNNYINYLNKYLNDSISAEYNPCKDFSKKIYNKFINDKSKIEKNSKKELRDKYYLERVFNIINNYEYTNIDRQLVDFADSHCKYEPADLYNNNEIVAVKFGNSSAELCYVIDQSLLSLRGYFSFRNSNKKLGKELMELKTKNIKNFCIWILIKKKTEYSISNKFDLTKLKYIAFKMALAQWAYEVRQNGFIPKVYVNFYNNRG